MEEVFKFVMIGCITLLGICMFLALIRVIKGPRLADRMVGVNMIGTMTIVIMIILSILLKENFLIDVSILYALLSFLAAVSLSKVYIGAYKERHKKEEDNND